MQDMEDPNVKSSKQQSLDGNDWAEIMKDFKTDAATEDNNLNIMSNHVDEVIKKDSALKNVSISTNRPQED